MVRVFGLKAYFGDATRPDLLAAAGIAEARLLVIAIDDKEQITELVRYVTQTYPKVHIMARAHDRNHVYDLWAAGCRDIIRETYDSSIRMGRSAFGALGIPEANARAMADAFSDMDKGSMRELADAYDPAIPVTENAEYLRRAKALRERMGPELTAKMAAIRGQDAANPEGENSVTKLLLEFRTPLNTR